MLWINDIYGDKRHAGVLDLNNPSPKAQAFFENNIYPYVKVFSFADALKKEICINLLGLEWKQCYGSDEDKNSLTSLYWEDMPGVVTTVQTNELADRNLKGRAKEFYSAMVNCYFHKAGQMTAREVMEYVGTSIFRKMYEKVWINRTVSNIKTAGTELALIADVRFPNEVEAVKTELTNSYVVNLTRRPFESDALSEISLLPDNYDPKNFTAVIDNKNMTLAEKNKVITDFLFQIEL